MFLLAAGSVWGSSVLYNRGEGMLYAGLTQWVWSMYCVAGSYGCLGKVRYLWTVHGYAVWTEV